MTPLGDFPRKARLRGKPMSVGALLLKNMLIGPEELPCGNPLTISGVITYTGVLPQWGPQIPRVK